jgi:hypothetical protein
VALRLVTEHEDVSFSQTVQAVVPPQPITLTASEITGLIGLFQTMLDKTEGRILDAMAGNSERATERWAKHDAELERNTKRVTDRFAQIDARLQTTVDTLQAHLDREHDDDIRMDARIRPIRGSLAWLWAHWRDVVLLMIGLIALGTFAVEAFGRVLGPHVP